ncbi:MAG TPA: hypothetical protein VEY71_01655, partial [Chitinophagales bacterium]|nr:hypothetical protein [Chitinophagales bacterium]
AWLAFTKTPRAQTTDVGGVINQYTEVLGIAPTGCYTNINVANGSFFSVGDTVLIIQMKGATLDLSNTPSFGTVIDYDNAGNYEFAIVDGVSGNTVSVGALTNAYSISGSVQLVTVPVYANANVTSTLTATAWNGAAAGVLVFIVNGTLTLNADIDLTAKGFRGGDVSNNPDGGCGAGSPDFFYPLSPGGTGSWTEGGAMKGEGIGSVPANMLAGKGKQANGGGGGNKHNTGGGGGGNFTSGGKGGNEMVGCVQSGNGGLGGDAVPSLPTKVYLGGGGGCGDYNNNVGTNGADGGGIALIKANEIVGNGFTIKSNGEAHVTVPNGIGDGEGGGGAGGSIYMAVTNYTGALLVQTNGSNGGNQNSTYGCFGPGGGGGSGIVGVSVSLPANVAVEMNAGLAGINVNPALPCYNTTYGATDADQNTSGPMAGVAFVFPTPSTNPALLNLGPDTVVCAGSAVMFDATVLGATYVWNDGSTAATLAASSPGIYSVTVTTASCGVLFDTIDVAHEPYPVVDLGNDTSLCPSTTFELNAFQSDVTFLWQDGSTDATFTITNPSVYGVTVTSLFGCSTSDDVQIEYETAVLINIGPDTVICSAQSYQLTAAGNGASFLWQDGSTGSTIAATSSGLYTVT